MLFTPVVSVMVASYVVLLAILLYTIKTDRRKTAVLVKTSISIIFTILAIHLGGVWWGTVALVCGLIFSVGGDIALGLFDMHSMKDWPYYYGGVAEFVIAQAFYFYVTCLYGQFYAPSLIISLIITVGFMIMNKDVIFKVRAAQVSMLYSFAITAVLFNSIFVIVLGPSSMFMIMFFLGILLFWISDYVLFGIVFRYEKYTHAQNYINKVSYFIGQLIIVLGLYFAASSLIV